MPTAASSSPGTEIQVGSGQSHGLSRRALLITLCALPLLLVYGILGREATALPLLDDYHAIFVFAIDQTHLSGMGKLAAIVTAQHNEYKLIFEHATVAADVALSGRIHLPLLVWLGNLLLLPMGMIFWAQFRPKDPIDRRLILFLPLCWLLFQLTYAEMVDWAMEGLQALAVVCFAVASFYMLTRQSRRSFVLACVAGALSACASANGFAIAPIGLVMLLVQRRVARVLPWCLTFGAAFAAYIYRYTPTPHGPPASLGVRLLFLPSVLGGVIENMHGFPVRHAAIALGMLLLAVYAHAAWHRYYKAQPFIAATATWTLITAMMTAWVRSSLGLSLSLSSRYKIYSTLMLVFCYQYLADRVIASATLPVRTKRTVYVCVLTAAVLFGLMSDAVGLKLLKTRKAEAIAGLRWYLAAPQTHTPFPDHLRISSASNDATGIGIEARQSLTEALQLGIYRLPTRDVAAVCAAEPCAATTGRSTPGAMSP